MNKIPLYFLIIFSVSILNACTSTSSHTTSRSANNNAGLLSSIRDLHQGNYQRHIDAQQQQLRRRQQLSYKNQQSSLMLKNQQQEKSNRVRQLQIQLNEINAQNKQDYQSLASIRYELQSIENRRLQTEQYLAALKIKRANDLAAQQRKQYHQQQLEKENLALLIRQRNLLRKQLELLINRNE